MTGTVMLSNTTPEGVYLDDLGPNDVLLGRGTGPNEHRGNVKFRCLLQDRIEAVCGNGDDDEDGPRNDPYNSRHIAIDVIDRVMTAGGHFVRKLTDDEIKACSKKVGKSNCLYVAVSDQVAREKTKQSILFQIRSAKKLRKTKTAEKGAAEQHKKDSTKTPTTMSKSAAAILKAKKRGRASPLMMQPQGPHEDPVPLSPYNKSPSMLLGTNMLAGHVGASGAFCGTGTRSAGLLSSPGSRLLRAERLYSPPMLSHLPSVLPGSSLLYPSTMSSPMIPTAMAMTPPPSLYSASRQAAYERFLAHEQLMEERHMRFLLMEQEQQEQQLVMLHGAAAPTNRMMLPSSVSCYGEDPALYFPSSSRIAHPQFQNTPQPVPSAPMSS